MEVTQVFSLLQRFTSVSFKGRQCGNTWEISSPGGEVPGARGVQCSSSTAVQTGGDVSEGEAPGRLGEAGCELVFARCLECDWPAGADFCPGGNRDQGWRWERAWAWCVLAGWSWCQRVKNHTFEKVIEDSAIEKGATEGQAV